MFDRSLISDVAKSVVGRRRELEAVVAALAAGRHLLLEGPPGTGKSTLLHAIAERTGAGFEFVEGNAELTPSRLVGTFDPAAVLEAGYSPDVFIDGPLVTALRDGSMLYVEEINRVPEETLNVLISVMSEGELHVPRLGHVAATDGFRLVAAMNPFDAVGTARIAAAVYDRCCRLAMGYQDAGEEMLIVGAEAPDATATVGPGFVAQAVEMVRATRDHPDLRSGSSVRGAIDFVMVAHRLADLRALGSTDPGVTLDAAMLALSGRVRVREGSGRSGEDVVEELWRRFFAPDTDAEPAAEGDRDPKSLSRPPGGDGGAPDVVKEGEEARRAVAEAGRRTTSRRELSRQRGFDEVSPEIGELDEDAFEQAMDEDPDAALTLLAELTGATDERLRELARRLAGRVIVDLARVGVARRRGVGRISRERARSAIGDVDLDASVDAIVDARSARRAPNLDDLTVQTWRRPDTALCLLVDRSGSMLGARLAAAAVAAAAVVYRHGHDCSVVAFSDEAIVLKSQDVPRSADELVGDLLRLRGHGTTDVGLALRTARLQLGRSSAGRRVAVLLSDCRPTTGGDPTADAATLDELAIVAPEGDLADAQALADSIGGRCVALAGPAQVPEALAAALLG